MSDWDSPLPEAAFDSYATARTLARLGDDRYDTLTDSIFDEDAELLDILAGSPFPRTPYPETPGERHTEPETSD